MISKARFVTDLTPFLIGPQASIRDAIKLMDANRQGIVLVCEVPGKLDGTITDGDIRRTMLAGIDLDSLVRTLLERKGELGRAAPLTAPASSTEIELLHLMTTYSVRHIPILDDDRKLVGIALVSHLAAEQDPRLQAVVMAGGFGTRLHPLTENTPKPMLPVGGRPLMERIIENLKGAGVKRVDVTTHYRPEKIVEHFGSGDDIGIQINYINENEPLGTAGALRLMENWDETLLVINGDILTTVDFGAMLDFHRSHDAVLTVAVRQFDMVVPYGVIECEDIRVSSLKEKPRFRFFVNAGMYLIEPSASSFIANSEKYDMTDLIQTLIAEGLPVISFPVREYWLDIGQHEDYQRAQNDVKADEFSSSQGQTHGTPETRS